MKILLLVFSPVFLLHTAVDACLLTYALIELVKETTHDLPDLTYYPPSTKRPKKKTTTPRQVDPGCISTCDECSNYDNTDTLDNCYKHCEYGNNQEAYEECIYIVQTLPDIIIAFYTKLHNY
ncbi:hypothetical protein CAPTEDRAFT_190982 [Capitella teleta]|uniref:Secreted protein n=1 Tax=Capitella teleta TaxID=283909 RepID=R7TK14_CAPTE|nr:hypothetical protein CAPTEDRAFT_190982 [Capitella teleta]|eukprot:ELT93802.1 hypothetical protein CAPTEDRAFT_190982 [Capitella teleta]